MYIHQSGSRLFTSVFTITLVTVLGAVFLATAPIDTAHAQSYQQRQKIMKFKRIQAQKRARYRRYQQQRQRQRQARPNTGLFGALFGANKVRRRADPYAPTRPLPVQQTRTIKAQIKPNKSASLLNYNNTKVKKIKPAKGFRARSSKSGSGRGAGRAMCVRLCDGFYWPVNRIGLDHKKTKNKAICQNSCSATTHVYYAGGTGDAGQSMRDYRGNRYRDLKNAFVYRKKLSRTCRCRPEPWTEAAQKMYDKRSRNAEKLLLTDLSENKEKAKRVVKFRTSMTD